MVGDIPVLVVLIGLVTLFCEARVSFAAQSRNPEPHRFDATTELRDLRTAGFWRLVLWLTLVATSCYLWQSPDSDDFHAGVGAAAIGGLAAYALRMLRYGR